MQSPCTPNFLVLTFQKNLVIVDIIIYVYLSSGTSHEIHSPESTYIKPPGGNIPLEAFFDFSILAKNQSHRKAGAEVGTSHRLHR